MNTRFSARWMKSSPASPLIWAALTPGWRSNGKVSSDHCPGQLGLGEAIGEAALLAVAPLLEQQAVHHLRGGQGLGVGLREDALQALGHALEVQLREQLLDVLAHQGSASRSKKSPATRSRISRSRRLRSNKP